MREDANSSASFGAGEAGNVATNGIFSTAMDGAGKALSGSTTAVDADDSLSGSEGTTTMDSGCVGCKLLFR